MAPNSMYVEAGTDIQDVKQGGPGCATAAPRARARQVSWWMFGLCGANRPRP